MTNKTKADEAVSMLEGEPMVERADAAMTLIDHVGISGEDYDQIAVILADGLLENGHIDDDDDGVSYEKVLACLKGEEV